MWGKCTCNMKRIGRTRAVVYVMLRLIMVVGSLLCQLICLYYNLIAPFVIYHVLCNDVIMPLCLLCFIMLTDCRRTNPNTELQQERRVVWGSLRVGSGRMGSVQLRDSRQFSGEALMVPRAHIAQCRRILAQFGDQWQLSRTWVWKQPGPAIHIPSVRRTSVSLSDQRRLWRKSKDYGRKPVLILWLTTRMESICFFFSFLFFDLI